MTATIRTWLLAVCALAIASAGGLGAAAQIPGFGNAGQTTQGAADDGVQLRGVRTGQLLSGESENVDPTNNPARAVLRPKADERPAVDPGSIVPLAAQATAGLVLNAYVDSSITSNANSAAIQAMISQAVAVYQSQFSDPISVSILFRYATTAPDGTPLSSGTLAQSSYVVYFVSWTTYINALRGDAKTSNDRTANASLPSSPLSANLDPSSANGRAVGLNTPAAVFADGHVGSGGPYDGIVTLNSSKSFQFTRPTTSNQVYDALRSTEHEIDEILGLGSNVNAGSSDIRPTDLYSWSAPGTRSLSPSGSRYFSIDGGGSGIVGFNQDSGGDYGDWLSGSCPQSTPYVQNAFSCAGQYSDVTSTSPEAINLDVIGYDLASSGPTPTPSGAPGPPSGLTTSSSGSTVFLAWSAPASGGAPSAYIIEAGSASGLANLANFSTGNTSTSFSAAGVGAGSYYVRVKATNSAGTSAASNEAILTVGGGGCTAAPAAPSGFALTFNSGGTVSFAWNASAGATTYLLDAGSSPGSSNLVSGSDLGGTATTFTATGVGNGTYYVRVRARNGCGTSGASNEVTLVIGSTPPPSTISINSWSAQFNLYLVSGGYQTIGSITLTLNQAVSGTYRAEFNSYGFIGATQTFSPATSTLVFPVNKITSGCPDLHGTVPLYLYNASNQIVASVQAELHGTGCAFSPATGVGTVSGSATVR